jgi:hypothetical protein
MGDPQKRDCGRRQCGGNSLFNARNGAPGSCNQSVSFKSQQAERVDTFAAKTVGAAKVRQVDQEPGPDHRAACPPDEAGGGKRGAAGRD